MAEKVPKKTVVIVGGGAAGGGLARDLSKKLDASLYNIVLVNDRTFYVHLIAMARIAVSGEDKLEDKALFGFDKLFYNGNGTVKIGKAVAIAEAGVGKGGELVLEDGERIPYTSLVLATGSTWPSIIQLPGTESEAKTYINSWRSKVEKAQHVVVVGGGAVGIGTSFPHCTLIAFITVFTPGLLIRRACGRDQRGVPCELPVFRFLPSLAHTRCRCRRRKSP